MAEKTSEPNEPQTGVPAKITLPRPAERRRFHRAKVSHPVRLRPSDYWENQFDEVLCTVNACRDGLCFTTWRHSYRKGMQLLVTFPYSSVPGTLNVDYVGRVVRVEDLSDGRRNVAVHLVAVIHTGQQEVQPIE